MPKSQLPANHREHLINATHCPYTAQAHHSDQSRRRLRAPALSPLPHFDEPIHGNACTKQSDSAQCVHLHESDIACDGDARRAMCNQPQLPAPRNAHDFVCSPARLPLQELQASSFTTTQHIASDFPGTDSLRQMPNVPSVRLVRTTVNIYSFLMYFASLFLRDLLRLPGSFRRAVRRYAEWA